MRKLRQLFDWALPEKWRTRRRLSDEQLVAALARIPEGDKVLAALMEIVHSQFELEATALLSNNLGQGAPAKASNGAQNMTFLQVNHHGAGGVTEFQRGRAAGLYALLDRIESAREEAREHVEKQIKQFPRNARPE